MKYRQRNPACHAHPDTRPLPVKKTKRKRVERGKRKHIKGERKWRKRDQKTGQAKRTGKEKQEIGRGGILRRRNAFCGWCTSICRLTRFSATTHLATTGRHHRPRRERTGRMTSPAASEHLICMSPMTSESCECHQTVRRPRGGATVLKVGGPIVRAERAENFFLTLPTFWPVGGTKYCLDR